MTGKTRHREGIQLEIPTGDFGAYLFDCDGTIADSMPIHFQAWSQAVAEHGGTFPEHLFLAWAGTPLDRTVVMLNETLGYDLPIDETVRRKETLYEQRLDEVQPVAAVVAEIERNFGRIPMAVVSGGARASVMRTLTTLAIADRFTAIVCAEDCARGKPHPDPFLRAAGLVGVSPDQCLVFEDAEGGIRAAEAAGMKWVRVVPPRA